MGGEAPKEFAWGEPYGAGIFTPHQKLSLYETVQSL